MKAQTAKKIMKLTDSSYQHIASDFSSTRKQIWNEFKTFKNYLKNGDKILDIGCGNGRLLEVLNDLDIEYKGVDKSQNLIKIAKEKYPDYEFEQGDILNLNLGKNQFDAVFCIAVLNHIPSYKLQKRALKNIYNIIKPGGRLIITNWNLWTLSLKKKSVFKYFFNKLFASDNDWKKKYGINKKDTAYKDLFTTWKAGDSAGILYYYAFTLNELKKILESAGFIIEEAYYTKGRFKGGNIVIIAKKKEKN